MKASFSIDENNQYTVDLIWKWYGAEYYFLNGELIKKQWGFRPGGEREISAGGHRIKLLLSVKPSEFICKVYKNDELFIEELFPELKEKVLVRKSKGWNWKIYFTSMAIFFVLTLFVMKLYK